MAAIATMRIDHGGAPLHNTHQTAAALLHALGLTAGGGLTLAALWKIGQSAGGALAKLAGWLKSRRERQFTESAGHEHNTIEQRRVDMEAKNAEEDRILRLADQVDRKTMGLITSLQRQVESQEERLSHLSTRIAQVEEAGRMSELTAQAAHIRADNSDEKYRAAKRELDILRADNARLTDQVREAAAAKEADQSVIAELRLHIQENMSRIESLELELSKHRRATHIAAEITLHDTQE